LSAETSTSRQYIESFILLVPHTPAMQWPTQGPTFHIRNWTLFIFLFSDASVCKSVLGLLLLLANHAMQIDQDVFYSLPQLAATCCSPAPLIYDRLYECRCVFGSRSLATYHSAPHR
jgi:hypothetical protein